MKKLFRFKYEPCNGMCYAYCETLMTELRKLTQADREALVAGMVEAHARLCDNPDYSFGVDLDPTTQIFVAHFRTPASTDLYANMDFAKCVRDVCKVVMATEIPKGDGQCVYGDHGSENLGQEILKFCTDFGYAELQARHCPCKDDFDLRDFMDDAPSEFQEALSEVA